MGEKISAMTPGAALTGAELFEMAQAAATRQGTITLVKDFTKPLAYTYNAPVNGAAITVGNGIQALVLEPAGVIAGATVTMAAAPKDGETIIFSTTQTITAFTLNPNAGQTIANAITTLVQNTSARYIYRAANTKWYRIG